MNSNDRFHSFDSGAILQILAGIGICTITVSLILLFNDVLSDHSPSVYLQIMIAGAIITFMAFFSRKIFSEWTN